MTSSRPFECRPRRDAAGKRRREPPWQKEDPGSRRTFSAATDGPDKGAQLVFIHRLHVIEVDGGVSLQSLGGTDDHLAGSAANHLAPVYSSGHFSLGAALRSRRERTENARTFGPGRLRHVARN